MVSNIICNITSRERRVALIENGAIAELFLELTRDQNIVGNIYKGTVTKVLPGMQVAFVDIGLSKAGFLYVSDVDQSFNHMAGSLISGDEEMPGAECDEIDQDIQRHDHAQIENILQEGQEIMVQVSKDPIGTKGARITSYITLPGRYLVFMPTADQIGVSRRIEGEEEKKRLKEIMLNIKKNGSGYIVRTAAEGKEEGDLAHDVEFLARLWKTISGQFSSASTPSLVYEDFGLIQKSIRDLYNSDIESIVIDDKDEFNSVVSFCQSYLPEVVSKLSYYEGEEPVFDRYGLEIEIERALHRKVWLRSGGYIVLDQTEALTTIDVNTGKFVGKHSLEETILITNLEAVKEIVYQLRLRNIGGIIIIDFIDMEKDENREKVYFSLDQALKNDRARVNILRISELGLVEMTRKRVRESLLQTLTTMCPYCEGRGVIKSSATVLYELYREIRRVARDLDSSRTMVCVVSPGVADLLFHEESYYLERLEQDLDMKLEIETDSMLHQERFAVKTRK